MKENQIKGVMTELVEKKDRKSAFEVLLATEDISMLVVNEKSSTGSLRLTINNILIDAKQKYARILKTKEVVDLFNQMADLETTIIQARCTLATKVKLTLVNQKRGGSETSYVVARAPFYNPDNVKAEIRVYLGKTEELGIDLAKLSNDTRFMNNAEKLIVKAMVEVMEKRGVLAGIKKSEVVKHMVSDEGLEETVPVAIKNKEKYKGSPYKPGPGLNPKPKSGMFLFTGKKSKDE
jgi:hypothetical protein